jgi:LmbE family N-acetylglucosaminyl deacetylase
VALGCADFVVAHPGTVVVTVAAGKPVRGHSLTDWDRTCGFHIGDDVVGARRHEDMAAMKILNARALWLEFLDHQYGPRHTTADIVAALEVAVKTADVVAFALGLGHEDHLMIAVACTQLVHRHPQKYWVIYEDAIYRATAGGTDEALGHLRKQGFDLTTIHFAEAGEVKRAAIEAYRSQVTGLAHLVRDAYRSERYWSITLRK